MKEFKKDQDGKFVCEECGRLFSAKNGLSIHIKKSHFSMKEYFDKWIKEDNEGLCKICGKETMFVGIFVGYKNCCCKECSDIYRYNKYSEGCMKIYGFNNSTQVPEIIQKIKQTNIERYGVDCTLNSDEGIKKKKQTWIKNYGVDNPRKSKTVRQKMEQTWEENYGVDNPAKSDFVKEKTKKTNNEKYSVDWHTQSENFKIKSVKTWEEKYNEDNPMKNKDICEKGQKSAKTLKKFMDTYLWYQGKYELDFLEKNHERFKDEISRGPSIKYRYKNKNRVYHSDFLIKSLNLVVECKNSWLAKRDKEVIEEKEKATIASGYNYIMIVDKDYTEFTSFLTNHGISNL